MSHRQFTDTSGNDWIAYDVTPRAEERRAENRRDGRDGEARPAPQEHRSGEERRLTVGGTRPERLTQGWICFEREGDRRRLQPIPRDWHRLVDAELCKLLEQARPAPQRKRAEAGAGNSQR